MLEAILAHRVPRTFSHQYKALRLFTPEIAGEWGFPTETPLFLSRWVNTHERCSACGCFYTPLAYRAGQVTVSQHFHDKSGGIYFYAVNRPLACDSTRDYCGWIADVTPIGKTDYRKVENFHVGSTEAVRVEVITPWCMLHALLPRQADNWHPTHPISAGLTYASQDAYEQGRLLPVCDPSDFSPDQVPFRFRVRENRITYTQAERDAIVAHS